jgi:hypothetical protein
VRASTKTPETPENTDLEQENKRLLEKLVEQDEKQRRRGILSRQYRSEFSPPLTYLLKLSRYIHLNPVCGQKWVGVPAAARRDKLLEYHWSTYRSYAGLEAPWSGVDYSPVQAMVEQLGVSYRQYVESGLANCDEEFRKLYQEARLSLGSELFTEQVQEAHQQKSHSARRPEDVAFRKVSGVRRAEEILEAVAAVLKVSTAQLRRRSRNSLARGAAAWALVRHAGLTERGAGEVLGIGSGAAVSQQLSRWRLGVGHDKRLQQIQIDLEERLRFR